MLKIRTAQLRALAYAASAEPIVEPCPRKNGSGSLYWIEIALIGEDDQPVPGESYELTLPDGTVVAGFLNEQGLARYDAITECGDCLVRFPDLDREAWSAVAAQTNTEPA